MSQESPKFNEIFVQPTPTKLTQYRFDLDQGESEARELVEDNDKRLIGFQSIDDLFSGLSQPLTTNPHNIPNNEHPYQQTKLKIETISHQMPASKKPNITINYVKSNGSNITHQTVFHPLSTFTLPPKGKPGPQRVKKVIEYQQRVVRVPIQREIIEYGMIEELTEPEQTLQIKSPRNPSIIFNRAKSPQSLPTKQTIIKPLLNNNLNFQIHEKIGQTTNVRHYVTCDRYSFSQRKKELDQLQLRMRQLRQAERQIPIKK